MNEDFAPFELAVKLKEKGFDEPCYGYYHCNGGNDSFELCGNGDRDFLNSKNQYRVAAPTISQVLKWLREEKKVFVLIDICTDLTFYYEIWGIEIALHPLEYVPFQKYQSYEKAALAGIEYVLDNLI